MKNEVFKVDIIIFLGGFYFFWLLGGIRENNFHTARNKNNIHPVTCKF